MLIKSLKSSQEYTVGSFIVLGPNIRWVSSSKFKLHFKVLCMNWYKPYTLTDKALGNLFHSSAVIVDSVAGLCPHKMKSKFAEEHLNTYLTSCKPIIWDLVC